MVEITFIDVNGAERRLSEVAEGLSLMEAAKTGDVAGIMADCGGACSCATCHVYVDPDWAAQVGPPNDLEFAMLDMVSDTAKPTSRLSCQIKLSNALSGLKVTVAPSV